MINSYVNIDTVLNKVVRDYGFNIDEGILIEWIAEGLGLLQVNEMGIEKRVAVMTIENYQCQVPRGAKVISQILKNNKSEIESIDSIVNVTQQTTVYNEFGDLLSTEDIDVRTIPYFDFNYSYFGGQNSFTNQFSIVKLANNSLFDVTTTDLGNEYSYSDEAYSLSVNGIIRFSFREGQIVIIYYQQKLDDRGYPMIPDNEYVIDALAKYVMYRNATLEYVRHIQGSDSRFKETEERWNRAKNIVRSLSILPSNLDEYNNLLRSSVRLLPRSDRHENFYKR